MGHQGEYGGLRFVYRSIEDCLIMICSIKWLEDLRMLAPHVPGAHLFNPDDSEDLDVLTPLV